MALGLTHERDYSYEQFGLLHKDDLPDLDHAEEMIKGILESIQDTNPTQFAHCVEELAYCFNIKVTPEQVSPNLFEEFASFTRSYFESLRRTA